MAMTSSERQKRYREKKRNALRNGSVTIKKVSVTNVEGQIRPPVTVTCSECHAKDIEIQELKVALNKFKAKHFFSRESSDEDLPFSKKRQAAGKMAGGVS